jgi:hypothetical protein
VNGDLVFALVIVAGTVLIVAFGFKNEIREERREMRNRDEKYVETLAEIPGLYDNTIRILATVPRPRPICMSNEAKWVGGFVVLVPLSVLAFAAYDQLRSPTLGITFAGLLQFFGLLVFLMGAVLWVAPYIRHERLVINGDMAIAKIISVGYSRAGWWVYYQFETPSGEKIRKKNITFEIGLAAGMRMPVFYNQENPRNAVALCTSFYDVVLPQNRPKS